MKRSTSNVRDTVRAIAHGPISTSFRAARTVALDCARGAALFCVTLRYTKRLYLKIFVYKLNLIDQ